MSLINEREIYLIGISFREYEVRKCINTQSKKWKYWSLNIWKYEIDWSTLSLNTQTVYSISICFLLWRYLFINSSFASWKWEINSFSWKSRRSHQWKNRKVHNLNFLKFQEIILFSYQLSIKKLEEELNQFKREMESQ